MDQFNLRNLRGVFVEFAYYCDYWIPRFTPCLYQVGSLSMIGEGITPKLCCNVVNVDFYRILTLTLHNGKR